MISLSCYRLAPVYLSPLFRHISLSFIVTFQANIAQYIAIYGHPDRLKLWQISQYVAIYSVLGALCVATCAFYCTRYEIVKSSVCMYTILWSEEHYCIYYQRYILPSPLCAYCMQAWVHLRCSPPNKELIWSLSNIFLSKAKTRSDSYTNNVCQSTLL